MSPIQLSALLIICSLATTRAQLSVSGSLFRAVRIGSLPVPAQLESLPGPAVTHCSLYCAARPTCSGFYWAQWLCSLFNATVFGAQQSWLSPAPSDVFVKSLDTSSPTKLWIKDCNMSSLWPDVTANPVCGKATDGNQNQNYGSTSCSSTNPGVGQWWEGALSGLAFVSFVTIYNRNDDVPERLNQFSLLVDGIECNRVNLTVPFSVANFSCSSYGSRVRVVMLQNTMLTICELEAYGSSL